MTVFKNGVGWEPLRKPPLEKSAYDEHATTLRHASPAAPNVAKSDFIKPPSLKQLMAGR